MELIFTKAFNAIIIFGMIVIFIVFIIEYKKIKKLRNLVSEYETALKIYSDNPQKFLKYQQEFLKWREQVELAKQEYFSKTLEARFSLISKDMTKGALKKVILTLERFKAWKSGKIE